MSPLLQSSVFILWYIFFFTWANQVMKLCAKMVEAGQAYSAANQLFLSSLTQLSVFQEKHSVVTVRTLLTLALLLTGNL